MEQQNTDVNCDQCESRKNNPFSILNRNELQIIQSAKSCNHYEKHEIVFYENKQPLALYCVKRGVVKCFRTNSEGRKQIVHLAKAGEFIGYCALLSGASYPFTAETVEQADICAIDKNVFFDLLDKHPQLVRRMLEDMCQAMSQSIMNTCSLAQKTVRERMAETLLLLKEAHGEQSDEGIKLNISLTRQEIADLAGTVLETAVRFLSEFKNDGYIKVRGREITILDTDALINTAGIRY